MTQQLAPAAHTNPAGRPPGKTAGRPAGRPAEVGAAFPQTTATRRTPRRKEE